MSKIRVTRNYIPLPTNCIQESTMHVIVKVCEDMKRMFSDVLF